MNRIKICENDRCPRIVPPSLNPGVERKYCGPKCANAVHQRRYRARNSGASGDGMLRVIGGFPYLKRSISRTSVVAEKRFKKHLAACATNNGDPCPARFDPYDKKRECLIHAVLREDWDQLRRAENGREWKRELTTIDGFWISTYEHYLAALREKSYLDDVSVPITPEGAAKLLAVEAEDESP